MNSHTQTQVFSASNQTLFSFLSDIQNLPKWATAFAQEVKVVDGKHKVVTPDGEIFFQIDSDINTGIIDMRCGPEEDQLAYFPSRVISLPGGMSAYHITNFQWPGVTDDMFVAENNELAEEFENIRKHVEVG